jgi:hypothetical protein
MRFIRSLSLFGVLVSGCSDETPPPVTSQDLQTITNIIRRATSDAILDVRMVRGSVIVDTGPERVVHHYYHLERKKGGWKITDHGS